MLQWSASNAGLPHEGSKGLGVLSEKWKQMLLSGPCIQGSS